MNKYFVINRPIQRRLFVGDLSPTGGPVDRTLVQAEDSDVHMWAMANGWTLVSDKAMSILEQQSKNLAQADAQLSIVQSECTKQLLELRELRAEVERINNVKEVMFTQFESAMDLKDKMTHGLLDQLEEASKNV